MIIYTAKKKTSKSWRPVELNWEQFLAKVRGPLRTGETMREYKAMKKEDQGIRKEMAGGFVAGELKGGQRKTENVVNRCMITLDADRARPDAWKRATLLMDNRMCCYSTHSHTPEHPRLRWIIPTDRVMTPDEYPAVARAVANWIDIDSMDGSTYEVARLMYWPTAAQDGVYEFHEQEGPVLSVDEVLRSYGPNDAWKDSTLWPIAKDEQEVRVREMKTLGDPREKPAIIGLFCRTFDIYDVIDNFLSDVYTEAGPDRYTYTGGSTAGGARVYNDGQYLYSSHATDPAGGQSCNAFDLVRIHKWGHLDDVSGEDTPVTKLPSYDKMSEWCKELPEVKQRMVEEQQARLHDDYDDLAGANATKTATDDEIDGENDEVDNSWMEKLKIDKKTGLMLPTLNNAILWIRNHPDFKGKFGYNPMADDITVHGVMPWAGKRKKKDGDELDNVVGDKEKNAARKNVWDWKTETPDFLAYFERFGYSTGGETNGMLENALKSVAMENTYHPIKSYLAGLKWDGVERLETMFVRWLGAEDNELNRIITRLWMIAAVDRIVRPGHQFDEILITCGPQGLGKTKMLRLLARDYFTNSVPVISMDKKTAEILQGMWIIELGELDQMKKGELTTIKNFVTATTDRYRGAYARQAESHPRQCVLAGTSNDGAFLRDDTGERRYWIMPVKGIGDGGILKGFEKEVDQLWAEAVVMWKDRLREYWEPGQTQNDVNLYLFLRDKRLEGLMEERRKMYKLPNNDRNDVLGYLDLPRPDNWYDLPSWERRNFAQGDWAGDYDACTMQINKVCIKELRFELFGDKSEKDLRIGAILDSAPGWRKAKTKRRNSAYAKWSMPMWVRIDSPEDNEEDNEEDDDGKAKAD